MMSCSFAIRRLHASTLALGTALLSAALAGPAQAQSFQGTGAIAGGSATIVTGSGTTTVTVSSPQAVVNWSPFDTGTGGPPINFQPGGTTATFAGVPGLANFAILNRILPADPGRAVRFDGNVVSQVQPIAGGPVIRGGAVYFYSPGGIILGGTARFDVGALGLSTASPTYDPVTGTFINGGAVVYTAANPGTSVAINAGAVITAPVNLNSYVAVMAPYIQQDGTINVNGSTALVAAEAGTITWGNGLFDVQIGLGSGTDGIAGVAIRHTGSTGGTVASSGLPNDQHRVYMVAIPKNSAITTLITGGSQLGFDIAAAADVVNNRVVLTAGYEIAADSPTGSLGTGTGNASIRMTNGNVTSGLFTAAKTDMIAEAIGGSLNLASDALFEGGSLASVRAQGVNASVNVGRDLIVRSTFVSGVTSPTVAGTAEIFATSLGQVNVTGSATVLADDFIGIDGPTSRRGGTARVDASLSATIDITSSLSMSASGTGVFDLAGAGRGGQININATGSGNVLVGGNLSAIADGVGQNGSGVGEPGGFGQGGFISILAQGGTANRITVTGTSTLNAGGVGGNATQAAAGTGTGGSVNVTVQDGSVVRFDSGILASAAGTGGTGNGGSAPGGDGTGGSISILANAATASLSIGQIMTLDADGIGGGTTGSTGFGGFGNGGLVDISLLTGTMTITSPVLIHADGTGGTGTGANDGTGGGVSIGSAFGTLTINGAASLSGNGIGGAAAGASPSGAGRGGVAKIGAQTAGILTITGAAQVHADGTGGSSTFAGASGGNAFGGTQVGAGGANVTQDDDGAVNIGGNLTVTANALGGAGFTGSGTVTGGDATGGDAYVRANGANRILVSGTTSVFADATGGNSNGSTGTGDGGDATGGNAFVRTAALSLGSALVDLHGRTSVTANAIGGDAALSGTGGVALGGTADITAFGTGLGVNIAARSTSVEVFAKANSGQSSGLPFGGVSSQGGQASIAARSATGVTVDSFVSIDSSAVGGGANGNDGGQGTGGLSGVYAENGGTVFMDSADPPGITLLATGTGGVPGLTGIGGNGVSGTTQITALSGGSLSFTNDLSMDSRATGANGGSGGDADGRRDLLLNPFGSTVLLLADGGTITAGGRLFVNTDAGGGNGLAPTGNGGSAFAGSIVMAARANALGPSSITTNGLTASLIGTGGNGGNGISSTTPLGGGNGGAGTGGTAILSGASGRGATDPDSGLLRYTSSVLATATGLGGQGGNGGNNLTVGGNGADGGAGGAALGGIFRIGAASTQPGTVVTGGLNAADIFADISATGGNGGNGGGGGPAGPIDLLTGLPTPPAGQAGIPGIGGSAVSTDSRNRASQLFSVGSPVLAGNVTFDVSATGGNGGTGLFIGSGGDATIGEVDLIVQNGPSTFRGDLTALGYFVGGSANPGPGGSSLFGGGPVVSFSHGDAAIDVVEINLSAFSPSIAIPTPEARIAMLDGTLDGFSFVLATPGNLSVFADAATLNTSSLFLSASDFVADLGGAPPASPGSLNADTVSINSGNNVIIAADLFGSNGFTIDVPGSITTLNIRTLGFSVADVFLTARGGDLNVGSLDILGNLNLNAGGAINALSLTSGGSLNFTAGDAVVAGPVIADNIIGLVGGTINFGPLTARGFVDLEAGSAITLGQVSAFDGVSLDSGDTITTQRIDSGATVTMQAADNIIVNGNITVGTVLRNPDTLNGYHIGLAANNVVRTRDLTAAQRVGVASGTSTIDTLLITAGTDVLLLGHGAMNIEGIASAGDSSRFVYIADSSLLPLGGPFDSFDPAPIFAATPVAMSGNVLIGNPFTGGTVKIETTGSVQFSNLTAQGGVFMGAGNLQFNAINAPRDTVVLRSLSNMQFNRITSLGDTELSAVGNVRGNSIISSDSIAIDARGSVRLVSGSAGLVTPVVEPDRLIYSIGIVSGSDITFGSLSAARGIGLFAVTGGVTGNLGTGALNAGTGALVLARTGVTTGAISAPGNPVYIADSSMIGLSPPVDFNFDPAPILNAAPTPMQGPINIGGVINGGAVTLASQADLTLPFAVNGSVSANLLSTTGTLTINDSIQSPNITTSSNDIVIGPSGRLNAGASGLIRVLSLNDTGMRIGDGVTGGGYVLDKAEFSRINSGSVFFGAKDVSGLPLDMILGDIDISGPLSGSTIDAPDGAVTFFTGDFRTLQRSGTIRVSGSVRAVGFTSGNSLQFQDSVTEVDAERGLIEIFGTGTTLAGTARFSGTRFHAAQVPILDRLAANPSYSGRVTDLQTPLPVARPAGIVRAADLDFDNAVGVLVQNTGTVDLPAGLLTTARGPIQIEEGTQVGSLEIIANIQLLTTGSPLTGFAVHDTLIDDSNRRFYASASMINGCLVSVTVCFVPQEEVVQFSEPGQDEFFLFLTDEQLAVEEELPDDSVSEEERKKRQALADAGRYSPIPPPAPLINTQPLNPPVIIEEPVSGSGNPALLGRVGQGNR